MNNPITRQQWIYDELLKEPASSYVEVFSTYSVKFSKTEPTFVKDWKKAKARHLEYQQRANEAKESASIAHEVETLKDGLKSKKERTLSLQKRAEEIEAYILAGKIEVTKVVKGTPVKFVRGLDAYELSALARAYKDILGEISKHEGDYAPEKLQVQDVWIGFESEKD